MDPPGTGALTSFGHISTPFICFCFCMCPPESPTPSLLKDLRKHQVHVERLSPLDLDQMARVIADAVHGVGEEGAWEGPGRGAGGNTGEPAGSSEEQLSEDSDQGRDGLRGETPFLLWVDGPAMDGTRPQSLGDPGLPSCDVSFLPVGGICVNDFYLFELLPLRAFLTG